MSESKNKGLTLWGASYIIILGGDNIGNPQTEASNKYQKKTYRIFKLKVRKDTQKDIIEHLAKQNSINGYVLKLIIEDMKK